MLVFGEGGEGKKNIKIPNYHFKHFFFFDIFNRVGAGQIYKKYI